MGLLVFMNSCSPLLLASSEAEALLILRIFSFIISRFSFLGRYGILMCEFRRSRYGEAAVFTSIELLTSEFLLVFVLLLD